MKNIDSYIKRIQERDEKVGAFLSFDNGSRLSSDKTAEAKQGLAGVPFAVKDNIALEGFPLTCGSKMLESMQSAYTATAVQRLLDAGAIPVGKTNMDEFGMGSATETSALGKTVNPWKDEYSAGGSSGGSAASVAAGMVPFALGTDTGGSVRQPAGFCGVFGLKPTYGSVSRYGLVAYASSLETIGVIADTTTRIREVFSCIRGQDPMDQTSIEWRENDSAGVGSRRLAFIGDTSGLHSEVARVYAQTREQAHAMGYETEDIDLSLLDYAVPAYYTIATAEASANLARYNGVRYGHRPAYAETPIELMKKSRSEGFGDEVKLRVMLGTYVLRSGFQDQFYVRAQRIRTKLYRELQNIFSRVEALVLPVFPVPPFRLGGADLDAFQQKQGDRFTTLANLSGNPACSFPMGTADGLPIGMQLMGPDFSEDRLLDIIDDIRNGATLERPPAYQQSLYDMEAQDV